jgi:hypothetical protein
VSQFLVIEEASNAVNAQIINQSINQTLNSPRKDPSENRKSRQNLSATLRRRRVSVRQNSEW